MTMYERRPKYGRHVRQITWVVDCKSLKYLWLRNFCSRTKPDENFLYRLPRILSPITWEWTGELELRRDTCKRLGYSQPPKPVNNRKPDNRRGGVIMIQSCGNRIDLEDSVVREWRNRMIRAAGSHPDLVLNFDKVKAFISDHWLESVS